MARKRRIFCSCGSEITVWKKGRKHKLYTCPSCGIVASNPISFGSIAGKLAKGALRSIPVVGGLAEAGVELAEEAITGSPKGSDQKFMMKPRRITMAEKLAIMKKTGAI